MSVALRKESVDRNILFLILFITIIIVALRKESVDRNYASNAVDQILPGVALRKESVDRNCPGTNITLSIIGRSPQGERG